MYRYFYLILTKKFTAMKKFIPFAIGLMTIILISCKKEDLSTGKKTGSLTVNIGLLIREYEVNSGLKASGQTDDFKVTVYKGDGTVVKIFETASVMPDSIDLAPGNYYVEAHSDNNLPAAFDNPYYYGVSELFTISSNLQQSVTVNCMLANTIVSVVYSDATKSSFFDYSATVSSTLGSLIFMKGDTSLGYFQPLPLNILVELTFLNPDGSENGRTLSGKIPDPLPGRHYQIYVNTSIDKGKATFQIILDETLIPVEVVELNDAPDIKQDSIIAYGEILITEIMSDPSALSDTQGEWFEIYNNSSQVINLQNLILERDSTNNHTITDSIELSPGEYYVLARTALASDASNSYVYGSAISLPNTGAVLSLYNKTAGTDPGALIFSVNYGGPGFPSLPGASIQLSPDKLNTEDAISRTSWCISGSVFSTGDSGTPGMINDLCQ
jgi:hypothetical protein